MVFSFSVKCEIRSNDSKTGRENYFGYEREGCRKLLKFGKASLLGNVVQLPEVGHLRFESNI